MSIVSPSLSSFYIHTFCTCISIEIQKKDWRNLTQKALIDSINEMDEFGHSCHLSRPALLPEEEIENQFHSKTKGFSLFFKISPSLALSPHTVRASLYETWSSSSRSKLMLFSLLHDRNVDSSSSSEFGNIDTANLVNFLSRTINPSVLVQPVRYMRYMHVRNCSWHIFDRVFTGAVTIMYMCPIREEHACMIHIFLW